MLRSEELFNLFHDPPPLPRPTRRERLEYSKPERLAQSLAASGSTELLILLMRTLPSVLQNSTPSNENFKTGGHYYLSTSEGGNLPVVHKPREVELRWLEAHPEVLLTHLGQWIALQGEELVAAGARLADVLASAHARGVARPLTMFIPSDPRDYLLGMSNQPVD